MTAKMQVNNICKNCEYYDNSYGDCHNSYSPRFNPEPDFSCKQFYPNLTNEEMIKAYPQEYQRMLEQT
jgi:hypothetical protein